MSASYWTSTQRNIWTFTKQELARERNKLWILESQTFADGLTVPMVNNSSGSNNGTTNNTGSINQDTSAGATKQGQSVASNNKSNSDSNNISAANGLSKKNGASGSISSTSNGRIVSKHISIYSKDLHYDKDYNLRIYCYFLVMKLGRRLNLRQIALSTANVYLSRFLLRVSVREVNIYLLVTTCIYLACKEEECPLHIRSLVNEARTNWPEFISTDATKVTEFEFYLIEELGSYLIIHHPYHSLEQLMNSFNEKVKRAALDNGSIGSDMNATKSDDPMLIDLTNDDDGNEQVTLGEDSTSKDLLLINAQIYQNTWSLINDSYITDVHLLYPPHVIAVACLMIALSSGTSPHCDSYTSDQSNGTSTSSSSSASSVSGTTLDSKANSATQQTHFRPKIHKSPSPSKKTQERNQKIMKKLHVFLAESLIDMEMVLQCCEELLNLYDKWERYNEDWTRYLLYHVYLVKR
ncbi:hypothetical protein ACO0QE_001203 [Hanseniaspora vineae]